MAWGKYTPVLDTNTMSCPSGTVNFVAIAFSWYSPCDNTSPRRPVSSAYRLMSCNFRSYLLMACLVRLSRVTLRTLPASDGLAGGIIRYGRDFFVSIP